MSWRTIVYSQARCEFTKDTVSFLKFYSHVCLGLVSFDVRNSCLCFIFAWKQKYRFWSSIDQKFFSLENTKFVAGWSHIACTRWMPFCTLQQRKQQPSKWTQSRVRICYKYWEGEEEIKYPALTIMCPTDLLAALSWSWHVSGLWKSCDCQHIMSKTSQTYKC